MFNPLQNEALDEWFQRFNAPLKRLPAQERAELHLEVRQHLEALAAANEELGSSPAEASDLALKQFGDPHKIGRRLFQEWQHSRDWSPDGIRSILFGIGQHLFCVVCTGMPVALWAHYQNLLGMLNKGNPASWNVFFGLTMAIFVNLAVGYTYPFQAIKGALYSGVFWRILFLCRLLAAHPMGVGLVGDLFLWSGLDCALAYLASVTKRGWYRPTLADFKLTLPPKRARLSR